MKSRAHEEPTDHPPRSFRGRQGAGLHLRSYFSPWLPWDQIGAWKDKNESFSVRSCALGWVDVGFFFFTKPNDEQSKVNKEKRLLYRIFHRLVDCIIKSTIFKKKIRKFLINCGRLRAHNIPSECYATYPPTSYMKNEGSWVTNIFHKAVNILVIFSGRNSTILGAYFMCNTTIFKRSETYLVIFYYRVAKLWS